MKINKKQNNWWLFFLIWVIGCKKPYNPSVTSVNYNYLVVEGLINTGQDSTIIKLSRSVAISARTTVNPELNALITIENDQNNTFALKELGNGKYGTFPLNLDTLHKYRIRIKTNDGKEYLSDFVKAKISPPIDSVQHQFTGTGENIYSYTHDPSNNTHYYRWEYQETYEYISPISTNYVFENGKIVLATPEDQITTCYVTDSSDDIILNSSTKLIQDIIFKNPITQVSLTLDKLRIRYSILVKQYALTADAYNYYQNLKQNTENLGSIFDAQPSGATSNIHCLSNVNERVLGYINAGTVTQNRTFIERKEIPVGAIGTDYGYCGTAYIQYTGLEYPLPNIITSKMDTPVDSVVINGINKKTGVGKFTVYYADPGCADCTLKGSNKAPSFW